MTTRTLFEINPDLDRAALAKRFAQTGRVQVRDVLTREAAEEIQSILMKGTPWGMAVRAGDSPDTPPRGFSNAEIMAPGGADQVNRMANAAAQATARGDYGFRYAQFSLVEALQKGKVARIILSRPAVEAGEQIGFLPGAMEDKLAPYLRPLYDALADRLSPQQLKHMMGEGLIEIAPIGFMRGRTLNNAFVVIDEAQNCTYTQLKMLLTRLGWHSTMAVTGDPQQSDLLPSLSGLAQAAEKLQGLSDAEVIYLEGQDIVRHPLVAEMLDVL